MIKNMALKHISVVFGAVQALSDVSLSFDAGQVHMLVGPNGAGKSTMLKVLLGLVSPEQGTILVDGKIRKVDKKFKENLGYLPEAVAFSDSLTGRQVLRFFASARAVSVSRIDEVLSFVGLAHAANRSVRGYSRGMRQRLGLGVSILSKPDILILDEPTGGLDMEGLSVLWSVLSEWREAGRIVLMTTHDLALLERRVDTMCVIKSGKVLDVGTPETIRRRVGLPITVHMELSEISESKAFVEGLGSWQKGNIVATNERDRLTIDLDGSDLLELLDFKTTFPNAIQYLRVEEPTLNEVYETLLEGE